MSLRRLTLGFSIFLPLFVVAQAFAQKKTIDQYWAEANVSRDMLRADWIINNQSCQSSVTRFRGCVQALSGVASRATPAMEVLPESVIGSSDFETGRVRVQLGGGLALVEVALPLTAPVSLRVAQTRIIERADKVRNAAAALYASLQAPAHVDFVSALEQVFTEAKLNPEIEPAAIAAGINRYLVEALDAHAHIDPMAATQAEMASSGEDFVGIGVIVREISGQVVIQQTIDGGPARRHGVKANDIILAVDGIPPQAGELTAMTDRIKGAIDTVVVLRVQRQGQVLPLEIPIKRAKISLPNVEVKVQQLIGQKILTVKLRSFMKATSCAEIQTQVMAAQVANPDIAGLIFDLRENGGGLLDQAVCIGGLWVGPKVILKVKDLNQEGFEEYTAFRQQITQLPMVTLINGGSASASEVLAGTLQDYQRSWIVGERSFGKATVQSPSMFTNDILLYRTIQRFYQPSGRTNQVVGILPDFDTAAKPGATEDERFVLREGDLYPNALVAIGAPWQQPRPDEVARIENCRARGQAEAVYRLGEEVDYQLQVGAEILSCN